MNKIGISLMLFLFVSSNVYSKNRIKHYTPDKNYNSYNAIQKSNHLWNEIQKYHYRSPYKIPTGKTFAAIFNLIRSMTYKNTSPSFLESSDFKKPAFKLLHRYGSTAKIEFVITNKNTKYTGMFKSGAIGFARLSIAINTGPFSPGFALKLLTDKGPSVNTHVMYDLSGQGNNQNFFANIHSNEIPVPSGPLGLAAKGFTKVIKKMKKRVPAQDNGGNSFWRPLINFARVDRYGKPSRRPVAPRHISFVPVKRQFGGAQMSASDKKDIRLRFYKLKPGTILYDVYVDELSSQQHLGVRMQKDFKKDRMKLGKQLGIKIGQLILRSALIPSEFGTRVLNFQHTY